MKNKFLSFLISAVVSLTCMGSITSGVSATDNFCVKISTAEAEAGESFELVMELENIPDTGINGCDFGISYDSSLVTIDSVKPGPLVHETIEEISTYECIIDTDIIQFIYGLGTYDSSSNIYGSGTFLTITGKVNSTAAAGSDAVFSIVPVDRAYVNPDIFFGYLKSEDEEICYYPEYTDGHVIVTGGTSFLLGDVNRNGIIDLYDVVEICKYILDMRTFTDEDKIIGDYTCNGIVDLFDAIEVARLLL